MKQSIALATVLLTASLAHAGGVGFSAADVPGTGLHAKGRVKITNDSRSITAWHFDGNIREALVRLKMTHSLRYVPAGEVYNSNARISGTIPVEVSTLIQQAATQHGVDPRLITAVARQESGFNPRIVSRVGAIGVMQLMPDTAKFLGVGDAFDMRENIFAGTRYLRMLLDSFHGDLSLALAAYNAGPGAVERYGGVPPYRETMAYVTSVRGMYDSMRSN